MKASTIEINPQYNYIEDSETPCLTGLILNMNAGGAILEKDVLPDVQRIFELKAMPRNIVTMITHTVPKRIEIFVTDDSFNVYTRSLIDWHKRFKARRAYVFGGKRKKV